MVQYCSVLTLKADTWEKERSWDLRCYFTVCGINFCCNCNCRSKRTTDTCILLLWAPSQTDRFSKAWEAMVRWIWDHYHRMTHLTWRGSAKMSLSYLWLEDWGVDSTMQVWNTSITADTDRDVDLLYSRLVCAFVRLYVLNTHFNILRRFFHLYAWIAAKMKELIH